MLADLVGGPLLDDLAVVHDRDPVGDVADDADVVGDEEVGEAELVLEVVEQVDDLRLDRDVERGDRLVGDISFGCRASARAIPIRCRWPPENSCG